MKPPPENPFEESVRVVLNLEGKYVDDPSDPGGPTNQGITLLTYMEYLVKTGEANETIKKLYNNKISDEFNKNRSFINWVVRVGSGEWSVSDMKKYVSPPQSDMIENYVNKFTNDEKEHIIDLLNKIKALTKEDAKKIYRVLYWEASGANNLPWPLSLVHFDAAVNQGVGSANSFLKDPKVPKTEGCTGADEYLNRRKEYYEKSGNTKYIKGWLNRVEELRKIVQSYCTESKKDSSIYKEGSPTSTPPKVPNNFSKGNLNKCPSCTQLETAGSTPPYVPSKPDGLLIKLARDAFNTTKKAAQLAWQVYKLRWLVPLETIRKIKGIISDCLIPKGSQEPPICRPPYPSYKDGQTTKEIKPKKCPSIKEKDIIIYVNGILTDSERHDETKQRIADLFCRPVIGVYNKTDGIARDLKQSIGDKLWPLPPFSILHNNPATDGLYKEIIKQQSDSKIKSITIVVHSQGAIIASNALRRLCSEGKDISKVYLITMGGAATLFPSCISKKAEHWKIDEDLVAKFFGAIPSISAAKVTTLSLPDFSEKPCDAHSVDTYLDNASRFIKQKQGGQQKQ